jgi:iron-sulfur cluster repair protein YtfE (RIC family)
MDPIDARQELLRQHERLRGLLSEIEAAARQFLEGGAGAAAFGPALAHLRTELAAHNAAEEAWLLPLLRADPSWGSQRVERMFEEHAGEHAALASAFVGLERDVAARIDEVAEELRAHMDAEERTILHPRVLR